MVVTHNIIKMAMTLTLNLLVLFIALLLGPTTIKGSTLGLHCLGDECASTPNTFCDNGVCVCRHGYHNVENSCLKQCNNKDDCTEIADSLCVNGACSCPSGYLFVGDRCLIGKLGLDCEANVDCMWTMNNTRCLRKKCECLANYFQDGDNICRLRRLGEGCTKSVECDQHGPGGRTCDSRKVCSCAFHFKEVASPLGGEPLCVRSKLGDLCTDRTNCSSIKHSVCMQKSGHEKICECARWSKPSSDNETCSPKLLNDVCVRKGGVECKFVNNGMCNGVKCVCKTGFYEDIMEDGRTLFCKSVIGHSCLNNDDCTIDNSVCKDYICSCSRGFSFLNATNQCTRKVVHGTDCILNDDCLVHFDNTVCDNSQFCSCEEKYYLDDSGHKCAFKFLGEICLVNSDCNKSVDFSVCVNNKCQCQEKRISREDKRVCLLKRLEGMQCANNNNCTSQVSDSFCDGATKTCICNVGYQSNEMYDSCIEKRVGDRCSSNADCNTTNVNTLCSSVTKKCQCLPGHAASISQFGNVTYADKPVCSVRRIADQLCEDVDECSSTIANSSCRSCLDAHEHSRCHYMCRLNNSVEDADDELGLRNSTDSCSLQTCLCNKGFVAVNDGTRCEGRKLREPCRFDEDCSGSINNSICWPTDSGRVCYCGSGYKEDGREFCIQRVIGDRCRQNSDCETAIKFSHCYSNSSHIQPSAVCKCNSGYHGNNGSPECQRRQIGDRTCAVDSDCSDAVNNSYCLRGMCACLQGYSSHNPVLCHARRLHQDYCNIDLDCSPVIENSICKHNICVCQAGYFNDTENICIKRNLHDKCTSDLDCSDAVNNSLCVGGICWCASGYFAMSNNSCLRRKILDPTCETNSDCQDAVTSSHCDNGVCVCNQGHYHTNNMTECIKRTIGDNCSVASDCNIVIQYSTCVSDRCVCVEGFDGHDNNSRCVAAPTHLGKHCYFNDQCQRIDPNSFCDSTRVSSFCNCAAWTFMAMNRSACIAYPSAIGDYCWNNQHCIHNLTNTYCDSNACICSHGFFVDIEKSWCHPDPQKLGDYCQDSDHCLKTINNSTCEMSNNTCVCEYGNMQTATSICTERPLLPTYIEIDPPSCQSKCNKSKNNCTDDNEWIQDICPTCDLRHARSHISRICVSVQTYELHLAIAMSAGKYDYKPIEVLQEYLQSTKLNDSYIFASRITLGGIMTIFLDNETSSPLTDNRYVSSEVIRFQNLTQGRGILAIILLHLTANYRAATPLNDIYNFIVDHLSKSDGVLGKSALKVTTPVSEALVVHDYNECAIKTTRDCSPDAMCINTIGSFMCVCKSTFADDSKKKGKLPGRVCVNHTEASSESDFCSNSNCETKWEFVGLTVTLFLLLVMVFITYEIIQRKQTFTARKLYEKFGTTKIRNLRQARIQRTKERKKRKKEENIKKKDEEKQNKEELKREKSEKRKQKESEKKMKKEEKKQKDLKRKAQQLGKSQEENVECLEEKSDIQIQPSEDIAQSTSLPYTTTTHDTSIDISSLPGSVNVPEVECGISRRTNSSLEESPV